MLWQKASATTWPRPCRRARGPSGGRAGCARSWRPARRLQKAAKSCRPEQAARGPVHAPRRRAARAPARCRAGAAGPGWPGRRRSGRGSAAAAPRSGRRNPPGATADPPDRQVGREDAAQPGRGGLLERAARAAAHLLPARGVDVGVAHLAAGVHPGIRAAGDDQAYRGRAAQDGREGVAEGVLDGAAAGLGGPPGERRSRRRTGRSGSAASPRQRSWRLARLPLEAGSVVRRPCEPSRTRDQPGVGDLRRGASPAAPWRGDHRDHPGRPPADPALRRGRRLLRPGPALHLADPAAAPDQGAASTCRSWRCRG